MGRSSRPRRGTAAQNGMYPVAILLHGLPAAVTPRLGTQPQLQFPAKLGGGRDADRVRRWLRAWGRAPSGAQVTRKRSRRQDLTRRVPRAGSSCRTGYASAWPRVRGCDRVPTGGRAEDPRPRLIPATPKTQTPSRTPSREGVSRPNLHGEIPLGHVPVTGIAAGSTLPPGV
jgi:hypothetical protein